ncbi:MAG: GDSL-type esterase/lipase family protein [Bacteroidota bacterium]|nr:GDSL-type esterase/lipase family protein [Bacteroidota bacterium]
MKQLKSEHSVKGIALFVCLFFSVLVSAQKQKVSCVGNSITYGYDLSNPSTQSYPGQLQALLGTTDWEVGNFGDSGRTMLKNGGYSYWDSQRYKDALASDPNYLILKLGTNDSKRWLWDSHGSEFKSNYKAMVQSFQNLSSKPEIWICLLIPSEKSDWDIFKSYIKDKVNPKIKEIALEMGLSLIDLYTELDKNRPDWYLADNVHPSVAGAGVVAQKVKEMLLMSKPEISYANGKVTAPDGDDYQWYIDGTPVASGNGGKQKEMAVTKTGIYKVSIKLNANNETRIVSKELNVSLTVLSGIDSKTVIRGIKVFPNPAFDVVNVLSDNISANTGYSISDLSGKTVLSGRLKNGRDKINISMLSAGTYTLAIGNECTKVIKGK